jgi:hypothetical protein
VHNASFSVATAGCPVFQSLDLGEHFSAVGKGFFKKTFELSSCFGWVGFAFAIRHNYTAVQQCHVFAPWFAVDALPYNLKRFAQVLNCCQYPGAFIILGLYVTLRLASRPAVRRRISGASWRQIPLRTASKCLPQNSEALFW